jgi:hypothetical protein
MAAVEQAMNHVEARVYERHDESVEKSGILGVGLDFGVDDGELDTVFGPRAGNVAPPLLAPDRIFDTIATCMAVAFLGGAQWQKERGEG